MNKRYMDFVPAKSTKNTQPIRSTHKVARVSTTSSAPSNQAKLGVVEELSTKPTRPKPTHFVTSRNNIKAVKSQKITQKATIPQAAKPLNSKDDKKTYKTPQTKFINQDKVKKRPLSKNVYRRKPVASAEEKKAPVTIINKPAKDNKVGLIITIIITIILGAVAGTVAFLLLPK